MVRISADTLQDETQEFTAINPYETDSNADAKEHFSAVFVKCLEQAGGQDGAAIAEYDVVQFKEPEVTRRIVDKILARDTPNYTAKLIRIAPIVDNGKVKYILTSKREKDDKGILTFFEVQVQSGVLISAELFQEFRIGKETKAKRLTVDALGNFEDVHIDANGREEPIQRPELYVPDLQVVADTVAEPTGMAVRHITQEFERVERLDNVVPFGQRIKAAKKAYEHPDAAAA